ncbi:amino acid ABC transporter permease [Variovorax sp. PBL-E5]|uniref:amino acid ABC transporter permease n=1 Tax=Variovorax sp. PBL-E5 TaxID=434014 RepID=UPI0013160190|nr:amino acid ABC transporter permease [Variovorax sp. PBL-E5]VTU45333.1 Inner membrane amino-acid ABC transporter permease protein YecS [Variovorax sp. PBL-E5]
MQNYDFQWQVVVNHLPVLLLGAWVDVWVSLFGFALACVAGLLIAMGRLSGLRLLTVPTFAFVQAARAIPPYVLLLWVHFGVSRLAGVAFTPLQSIVAVLTITGAGYAAEIFRSGILAVDRGQFESATSMGLSRFHTYWDVIFPQMAVVVVAPLGNVLIGLLKSATLMGVIAVPDLLHAAQSLNMNSFVPFEAFTAVLLIFVSIVFVLSLAIAATERLVAHP